jgi:hypothetical protein
VPKKVGTQEWWNLTMLAVAGEVLAESMKRLASATADEMPALETEAKAQIKRMVAC